jgi:hypothetical protein
MAVVSLEASPLVVPTLPLGVDLVGFAISSGEVGDGGVLERVELYDLFMEKRLVGFARGPGEGAAEVSRGAVGTPTCEVERRKRLLMVRLKLEVDPRVERRESGGGASGSAVLGRVGVSETAVSTAVMGLPVSAAGVATTVEAGLLVPGLGVGAWEVMRGVLSAVAGGWGALRCEE